MVFNMQNIKGKIIVIDGLDGSGKTTQANALLKKLKEVNKKVMLISYPDYEKDSSALVRMYLNGDFSQNLNDINAYTASTFYAVDRYAGYKTNWQKFYEQGYTIIASRYVTSNFIHQTVKLQKKEWNYFLDWASDFEYEKLTLPQPDKVIFLEVTRKIANELLKKRYNGDETKKDIHEKDLNYLEKCQETAHYCAEKFNWEIVDCVKDEKMLSVETITEKLFEIVKNI